MKVLVLYTEIMGYTAKKLQVMASCFNVDTTVVYHDKNKKTPYSPKEDQKVSYIRRSTLNRSGLFEVFNQTTPDLIFVAGWQDKGYLPLALEARKKGIPVVTGLDNQWRGNLRQRIACILAPFFVRRYFDYVQVAGIAQYEYALRLGFPCSHILRHVYSADTDLYDPQFLAISGNKARRYPHRFLFVGRLHPNKGLDILLKAWDKLCDTVEHDWELIIVGNGPLKETLQNSDRVIYRGFMNPEEIAAEVKNMGVFVLPSRKEPWGVVVHEFACAGLPLVISDVCGAASEFLIPNYNGFSFRSEDVDDLFIKLSKIVSSSDIGLAAMGARSYELSKRITPYVSVAALLAPFINKEDHA